MKHNYRSMRMRFNKAQEAQAERYRKFGMSEDAIQEMYAFDLAVFNSNRKAIRHAAEPEEMMTYDRRTGEARYMDMDELPMQESRDISVSEDWINDIEDERLHKFIASLSDSNQQLLYLLMKGYLQTDIARFYGVSRAAICMRLDEIKNKIKKF